MHASLNINGGPSAEAIGGLRKAITKILKARADQETIRVALEVLAKGVTSSPTSISNCHFVGDTSNNHYQAPAESEVVDTDYED